MKNKIKKIMTGKEKALKMINDTIKLTANKDGRNWLFKLKNYLEEEDEL